MTEGHSRRQRRRSVAALAVAVLAAAGACSDGGDDLSPPEPEAGEEGTEVVPGEGGPVE
ncbi:MAG: hypothetical protein M3P53_01300 [Actinomycetota bacterium]|nr:hypothetical protein [Actinomycetota bacterium]